MLGTYPQDKLTITGGGIIGALEAYYAFLDAKKANKPIRVTIYEGNPGVTHTTSYNIGPSLTPDETLSVIPFGKELLESLGILFSEPRGIKVEDVPGVNDSFVAKQFIEQAQLYSKDENEHRLRTQSLLDLGKKSMDLWQKLYDEADPELQQILKESNFHPCHEAHSDSRSRQDGYRIDLIYDDENAETKALQMIKTYESIGYSQCKILSPSQTIELDPSLKFFCEDKSLAHQDERKWKNNAIAIFRPGGCIDAKIFLPKFYTYLEKVMGQYTNSAGKTKNCFRLHYNRQVNGIEYAADALEKTIEGLRFYGKDQPKYNKKEKYPHSEYVFCPGSSVGTLSALDFSEPAYAGFAGASLKLTIPIPVDQKDRYKTFNHCMEVHKVGVVLAWQARYDENENAVAVCVAGTKAFYGSEQPDNRHAFAQNRHQLQLQMLNDVLPDLISLALKKDTTGQWLTEADLSQLVQDQIAKPWVGVRAVAYDGYLTMGEIYDNTGKPILNAFTTTHLGSGGVSFGPAAVTFSRLVRTKDKPLDPFEKQVLAYASTKRKLGS